MHLFNCCGKESVRLSETKSNEFASSNKTEMVDESAQSKKRGVSALKKWRRWTGKHFRLLWKRHKKGKASDEIESITNNLKPIAETNESWTSCADTWTSSTPKSCTEDTWTSSTPESCTEDTWTSSTLKSCTGDTWTSSSPKSCAEETRISSTPKSCTEDTWISSTPKSCAERPAPGIKIESDPWKSTCKESTADSVEKDRKNATSESSASKYEDCSNSSSSSSSTSSNPENKDDLSITNIQWIAGHEQKLCEENIKDLKEKIRQKTSLFLMSQQGQGEITLGDVIGKGGFGFVRKGKWTAHDINGQMTKELAIKIINEKDLELNELKALIRCKHRNITELHFIVIYAQRILLGLQLASRGDLASYLEEEGPLVESHARILFGQIVDAVQHCHINGIAHHDIKVENILMDDKINVKLTDFGMSFVQSNPANITGKQFKSKAIGGSFPYMAPEIFSTNMYDCRKCDVWSLGILLFEMLTDDYPYSVSEIQTMTKLRKEDRSGSKYLSHAKRLYKRPQFPPGFSTPVRGLIITMLRVKAKYRANISKVQHHYWLKNNGEPGLVAS